jgi:hypothetical protein
MEEGNVPNIVVPAPPESLFKLKFHQVAIYHHDPESAVEFWSDAGFISWTKDECLLRGVMEDGIEFEKKEKEWFNYDILPLELCYFQYNTGFYRMPEARDGEPPFLALMAAYVDNLEEEITRIFQHLEIEPIMIYDSVTHENPYLVERGITFHKCLYDTTSWLGFDVKLTQKVYS